jgi:hypothetical protein
MHQISKNIFFSNDIANIGEFMKMVWMLLLTVLLVSAVSLPIIYFHNENKKEASNEEFFFGVSFGGNTTNEAKLIIDKVKDYTNLLVINSWDISKNETALNEICQYAVDANMNIIVYFDYVFYNPEPWLWLNSWMDTTKERWGDQFLGIYLYDEPGGNQIDTGQWRTGDDAAKAMKNASDYSDAANRFVTNIPSTISWQNVKNSNLPIVTSDYALYWFDYLVGYDTVLVELGWNHSRTQNIALCRGAANVQDKDWGAIITWTYNEPPYLESGTKILQDMITTYRAGAKYVIVFNFPYDQPFGILKEEHFTAMETFWDMTRSQQQNSLEKVEAEVAFVLPKDYGWGMRRLEDKIWKPEWGPDDKSPLIWENMNKLIERYGLKLDIIYDDPQFNYEEKYSQIYYWNNTIN